MVYERNDVAAIIAPAVHEGRQWAIIEFAIGAANIAGSFFVPIEAVAITLRVFSGIWIWCSAWDATDNNDHNGDILLYQRPDTPLTVQLRQV